MKRLHYAKMKIFGYGYLDDSHHKWLKENVPIVFDHYMRLYMHYMPELPCDAAGRTEFLKRQSDAQFCNNLAYMRNRYGEPSTIRPLVWKFRFQGEGEPDDQIPWGEQDHSFTCYIEITKIEPIQKTGIHAEGVVTVFDTNGSRSTLFQVQFMNKHLIKAASILGTPMMNMDNQNRERNHLRELGPSGLLPKDIQLYLQWGLYLARRSNDEVVASGYMSEGEPCHIHHEPYELACFQRAIRVYSFENFTATNIVSYVYQEHSVSKETYLQTFELPLFTADWFGQFPLVDVTSRETRTINDHLHALGLSTAHNDAFDLTEYLKEPAYGRTLRLPITTEEILFDYLMKEEEDFIRFVIGFRKDDVIPFAALDFKGLHNFNIRESLLGISCSISFMNHHDLLGDYTAMYDLIPVDMREADHVVTILANALDIYVIGKNRPNKLRITKISKPKHPGLAPAPETEPTERDYVITRIMRTIRRTKDLCEELRRQGSDTPIQYVVESWKRVGHWRSTPTGGKTWIGPTTCHRHQPLTEKEVHIKL